MEIIRVPQGAMHIRIGETQLSKNYLGNSNRRYPTSLGQLGSPALRSYRFGGSAQRGRFRILKKEGSEEIGDLGGKPPVGSRTKLRLGPGEQNLLEAAVFLFKYNYIFDISGSLITK